MEAEKILMNQKNSNKIYFLISLFFLISLNLFGQSDFLAKWSKAKLNRKERIIMLNDYVIDFARTQEKIISLDSNKKRSINKSLFLRSNEKDVIVFFIDFYLFDKTLPSLKGCICNFIIKNLDLSSWSEQEQIFDNKISEQYLEERYQFRKKLDIEQINNFTELISHFFNTKNKVYYQKQIKLIYGYEVNAFDPNLSKECKCVCK